MHFCGSRKDYTHRYAVLDLTLRKAIRHVVVFTPMSSHTKANRTVHRLFIAKYSETSNSPNWTKSICPIAPLSYLMSAGTSCTSLGSLRAREEELCCTTVPHFQKRMFRFLVMVTVFFLKWQWIRSLATERSVAICKANECHIRHILGDKKKN